MSRPGKQDEKAEMEPTKVDYTIIGESSFYERMFYLYHRLGIQSNIIVSATYHHETLGPAPLTKTAVVNALRDVIVAHPRLQVVGVMRPSPKAGRHRLHQAMLHSIDIAEQVEFLDDEEVTSELLEKSHNSWDWMDEEPHKPFWKVLVVGRKSVVFIAHHFIGDAVSGVVFHREFLTALNAHASNSKKESPATSSSIIHADIETCDLPKEPLDFFTVPGQIWEFVRQFFASVFLDLLLRSKVLFSGLPKSKDYSRKVKTAAEPSQRTESGVSMCRVPAATLQPILEACRSHGITFTPVLTVMLLVTMAADFYPDALVTGSRVAGDLRRLLPLKDIGGGTSAGVMLLATANHQDLHLLGPFRRVAVERRQEGAGESSTPLKIDKDAFWALAKRYHADMNHHLWGQGFRGWQRAKGFGPDLEDFVSQGLYPIGVILRYRQSVSNLTAFDKQAAGPWTVEDMAFSAAPTNGNEGTRGLIFNVVGVKGKDTVITAAFERDVVPREIADGVLRNTIARLESLIQ